MRSWGYLLSVRFIQAPVTPAKSATGEGGEAVKPLGRKFIMVDGLWLAGRASVRYCNSCIPLLRPVDMAFPPICHLTTRKEADQYQSISRPQNQKHHVIRDSSSIGVYCSLPMKQPSHRHRSGTVRRTKRSAEIQTPVVFNFSIRHYEHDKEIPVITFKPPRFLGDGGWSSGWQLRRGSCVQQSIDQLVLQGHGTPGHLRDSVGTTSNGLLAALALPDANSLALDGVLAAEGADVAGVLGDFHLLHLLTQRSTVSVDGQYRVLLDIFRSSLHRDRDRLVSRR